MCIRDRSVLDCRKDFKFNQIENECRRKFILHQYMQETLQTDLTPVARGAKQRKGSNTFCFGDNRNGMCGVGKLASLVDRPSRITGKLKRVFCGWFHAAAIDHNRVAYTWGRADFGQLG